MHRSTTQIASQHIPEGSSTDPHKTPEPATTTWAPTGASGITPVPTGSILELTLAPHELAGILRSKQSTPTCSGLEFRLAAESLDDAR